MSKLLVRAGRSGDVDVIPEAVGWSYVGFQVRRLDHGSVWEQATGDRELCVVMLAGTADINEWSGVGARANVFAGPSDAVYLPPQSRCRVRATSELCEVAFCWAPATQGAKPALIHAADIKPFQRGSGNTARTIHNILMEDRPAESLLVTEVYTPGGNWSSYPPHKHDTDDPPRETCLEETYYHRLARPGGFAVQMVYTGDRSLDEAIQVRDGDVVLVPRGYHPVAAAAGYDLYYLNVMAGPVRNWAITTDPDHRWQLD